MNLEEAQELNKIIKKEIKGLYITGSLKRKNKIINDLDYITKRDLNEIYKDLLIKLPLLNVLKLRGGEYYIKMKCNGGGDEVDVNIDIWKVDNNYELFYSRLLHDLDKGHAIYWKKQAIKQGYKLTDKGLYNLITDKYLMIQSKKDLKYLLNIE